MGDGQTSLVYNEGTGELSVDAPAGKELTSINITSAGSKFIGDKPAVLDGAFDNFAGDNIFKATFGGSFGEITFGNVVAIAGFKFDFQLGVDPAEHTLCYFETANHHVLTRQYPRLFLGFRRLHAETQVLPINLIVAVTAPGIKHGRAFAHARFEQPGSG